MERQGSHFAGNGRVLSEPVGALFIVPGSRIPLAILQTIPLVDISSRLSGLSFVAQEGMRILETPPFVVAILINRQFANKLGSSQGFRKRSQ